MNIMKPPTTAEMTSSTIGWLNPASSTTMPMTTRPHTSPAYILLSLASRRYEVLMTSAASRLV